MKPPSSAAASSAEAGEEIRKRDGNSAPLALDAGLPKLASLEELPEDAVLVTVSAVGAPAAAGQFCTPMHYVRAVELLKERGLRVDGLITSENGGLASVNGWFQSAVLGIPVVDAPCNGRAHPMGTMGSIGLHAKLDYVSRQAAAGGNPETGKYVELAVAGSIVEASRLIRQNGDLRRRPCCGREESRFRGLRKKERRPPGRLLRQSAWAKLWARP